MTCRKNMIMNKCGKEKQLFWVKFNFSKDDNREGELEGCLEGT